MKKLLKYVRLSLGNPDIQQQQVIFGFFGDDLPLENRLAQAENRLVQLGDRQTLCFFFISGDLEVEKVVSKNMESLGNMSGIDSDKKIIENLT